MVEKKDILLACGLGGLVYTFYEFITPKIVSKEVKENIDKTLDSYVLITGLQNLSKVFNQQEEEL
jgi:hypothetical protein